MRGSLWHEISDIVIWLENEIGIMDKLGGLSQEFLSTMIQLKKKNFGNMDNLILKRGNHIDRWSMHQFQLLHAFN